MRKRRGLLFLAGAVALGVCLALIVFMVWTLHLRTEYRAVCLEINDKILAADINSVTIERNGEVWPLDQQTLDYFNMRLLGENVFVFNRKNVELDKKSIVIHLGDCDLSFTGLEDGSAINIRWETPQALKSYTVRSASVSFMQDTAYLSNYIRRLAQ